MTSTTHKFLLFEFSIDKLLQRKGLLLPEFLTDQAYDDHVLTDKFLLLEVFTDQVLTAKSSAYTFLCSKVFV